MGFQVNYKLLNSMYDQITTQTTAWDGELNDVKQAISRLQSTDNMSGVGATAIRTYLSEVHAPLVDALIALVKLHRANFVLYKDAYQQSIDGGFDVVIDETELGNISLSLEGMISVANSVDSEVRNILRDIKDIFPISLYNVFYTTNAINVASNMCSTLSENIKILESHHSQAGFATSKAAIDALTSQIQAYLSQGRSFMENYVAGGNRGTLSHINAVLTSDVNGKAKAVEAAVQKHEERIETEKRLEFAKWEKLIVTAAVVVASAVIVAALPVSGPLVTGLASAATSAIISGNNKMMDLYAEDGDLSGEDWKDVLIESGRSAAVGFASGCVGGIAGKYISGAVKSVPVLQMHSGNAAVDVVSHIAAGSVSEVGTGIVKRAAGETMNQIVDGEDGVNLSEIGRKAFDTGEIISDVISGGASEYFADHSIDYSESANTQYEKGIIADMHKKGEIDTFSDWDMDAAEKKTFKEVIKDTFINSKNDDLQWQERITVDNILSPDDYSDKKYDYIMGTNKALKKGWDVIDDSEVFKNPLVNGNDGIVKSNDDVMREIRKAREEKNNAAGKSGG